jgi:hypothetical protein
MHTYHLAHGIGRPEEMFSPSLTPLTCFTPNMYLLLVPGPQGPT